VARRVGDGPPIRQTLLHRLPRGIEQVKVGLIHDPIAIEVRSSLPALIIGEVGERILRIRIEVQVVIAAAAREPNRGL